MDSTVCVAGKAASVSFSPSKAGGQGTARMTVIHSLFMPRDGLENLKFQLLHGVTQERGNNFVLQLSLWSIVKDDINSLESQTVSLGPFAKISERIRL